MSAARARRASRAPPCLPAPAGLPCLPPQTSRPARVVNVASRLHYLGWIDRDDLNLDSGFTSLRAYSQSKLLQVIAARETQRRTGPTVRSTAVHPGEVLTNVINTLPRAMQWLYHKTMALFLLTPQQGARPAALLVVAAVAAVGACVCARACVCACVCPSVRPGPVVMDPFLVFTGLGVGLHACRTPTRWAWRAF